MTDVHATARVERTAHLVVCAIPANGLVAANGDVVRRMASEVAPGQSAVVDLLDAGDRIDGVGLASLLSLIAGVRRGGGVVAVAARGPLARRLRFVGLERVAPVCESLRAARSVVVTPAAAATRSPPA